MNEIWQEVKALEDYCSKTYQENEQLKEQVRKLESRCDRYEAGLANSIKINRRIREELDRVLAGVPPLGVE